MNRALLVFASVCSALWLTTAGYCQDARPWEQQGAAVSDEIVGPDGGKMVWVPAGEFTMGSPNDQGEDAEHPAHRVRITKGFWLGRCTVTNAQYRRYCQETGAQFPQDSDQGDDHPVVCVTWNDAVAYCQHYGLALPTEAQWEYAARGPEGREYPWGNVWEDGKCCNAANKGPKGRTFPVGSFPEGTSWCGALDMAGNVWQWCRDWFGNDTYANSPAADPTGPDTGKFRVERGGAWRYDAVLCRSADRSNFDPERDNIRGGFRCVVTP